MKFERFPDGKISVLLGHNQRLFYEPKTDTFTIESSSEDGSITLSVPIQTKVLERLRYLAHDTFV